MKAKIDREQDDFGLEFTHRAGSHKEDYVLGLVLSHRISDDGSGCAILTPEELLAFTRDLAKMQGCVVLKREELKELLHEVKSTLFNTPQNDRGYPDAMGCLNTVRDFANENNLTNP